MLLGKEMLLWGQGSDAAKEKLQIQCTNCLLFLLGYACNRTTATWHGGNAKEEERFFLSPCSCQKIITCSVCKTFGFLGNLLEKPRKWTDRIFLLPALFLCVCLSKWKTSCKEAVWKNRVMSTALKTTDRRQLWTGVTRSERILSCSFPAMLWEVNQLLSHEQCSKVSYHSAHCSSCFSPTAFQGHCMASSTFS